MQFEGLVQQRLEALHREGRYRIFADLKRRRGSFPVADHFAANGSRKVVRCGARTIISAWVSIPR